MSMIKMMNCKYCVTAPGENDGAVACKLLDVDLGVDVVVSAGVRDTSN